MDKGGGAPFRPEGADRKREYINMVKGMHTHRKPRYCIITFGCQMNENDSEKIAGMLEEMGYAESETPEESDVLIYNTCCVREHAEQKVYGRLGAAKNLKEKNPSLVVAVFGCMMQQEKTVEKIRKSFTHVDIVFGTHNGHKFPELLYKHLKTGEQIIEIWESGDKLTEGLPVKRKGRVKAWVAVMTGCDNFCSYCVVPYVRGRERSRKPEEIINEVRMLACHGYKEVTLLGQNVNSYGKDLGRGIDFPGLLHDIDGIEGIERIRFMTSHPRDMSDKLIKAMSECLKVCEHLHLPVQAGSTRTLERMNRGYGKEQYLELVGRIRERIPGIALTTDIMVGFPGETDEDFEDTVDILEKVRFDTAFTFIYSKRAGTSAAGFEGQVPEEVKKIRFQKLLEVQNRISRELNEKLPGTEAEVLVEGRSKTDEDFLSGRTRTNKVVNFKGSDKLIGKLVNVRIAEAHTWSLTGELL